MENYYLSRRRLVGTYIMVYTYVYARILLDSARAISCCSGGGGGGPPGTQYCDIAMAVGIRSRSVLVVASASPPGTPARLETISL